MFRAVSWHEFMIAIIVILVVYYFAIIAFFYRYGIMKILREGLPKKEREVAHPVMPGPQQATEPVLFAGINDLLEELQAVFENAAEKHYHREELMQALQSCLKNFRQLKDTEFEAAAARHIIHSAESLCNITLEGTDIKRLW